ncbi:unnamed protein product [Ostreobium quekettii]|uniref:Transcription factor CBF/NF-Y/archaeal histone domain-containing protein n=1 Tax=Ostreobium quekettii TaxID=121088 RepID=A0A8S1IY03_9CHLO|nr:unnamed protein product [Ostreobium quekettii]
MIKEFMPPELRLAGDATDMLIECCTEFVSLVSSESNEVSTEEKRNTIYPEHVIRALRALGFQEFVPDVTAAWEHWKQGNKCGQRNGGKKSAADAAGLTEEEQIELQQQLFAAARARSFQLPDPPASAPSTSQASGMQPSRTGSSSQGQPSSSTAPAAQPMARTASRTASNATQLAQGQALHPSSSPQASMAMPRLGLPPPSASSGTLSVNHAPSQSASMKAKVLEEGARAMQGSAIVASGSGDATEVPVPVPAGYRLVPQPPQQPQQPVFVVQQPVVEASGQEYRPEQHEVQLDWQQINGQVVMLQDGTLVSLQDLLLHVAQAQAAGTSDAVPEARTAAPAGPPPRQQAVSQPLQQPQTRGQHPLLLTPTVDQPGSQLASGRSPCHLTGCGARGAAAARR